MKYSVLERLKVFLLNKEHHTLLGEPANYLCSTEARCTIR